MKTNLFSSFILSLACLILFSGVYSSIIWGIAQFTPHQGKGEVLKVNQREVGFAKVGQNFNQIKYFQGRPSAVNYNAAGSGGSNKAYSNPDYQAFIRARIDTFLKYNSTIQKKQIPIELLTASGSGLDPHISPAGAEVQISRIARARNLSEAKIKDLVHKSIEQPLLGFLGKSQINVLALNIELDKLK
ncbi:MAG: potassium-transporting ATPase subunit KdpC [Microscillaceae bacterium]|jgi:K+-transporting ATPase ATPase C chain|nr:potassium-transporting ATPase subunit KdpC [Microscillaceae bacterium]